MAEGQSVIIQSFGESERVFTSVLDAHRGAPSSASWASESTRNGTESPWQTLARHGYDRTVAIALDVRIKLPFGHDGFTMPADVALAHLPSDLACSSRQG